MTISKPYWDSLKRVLITLLRSCKNSYPTKKELGHIVRFVPGIFGSVTPSIRLSGAFVFVILHVAHGGWQLSQKVKKVVETNREFRMLETELKMTLLYAENTKEETRKRIEHLIRLYEELLKEFENKKRNTVKICLLQNNFNLYARLTAVSIEKCKERLKLNLEKIHLFIDNMVYNEGKIGNVTFHNKFDENLVLIRIHVFQETRYTYKYDLLLMLTIVKKIF
ncbi:hypothetical protein CHUAL_008166 [Chamberlinius hualienensis]